LQNTFLTITYKHQQPANIPCGVTQQQKGGERTTLKQGNHVTGPYFMKILSPGDRHSSHPTPSVEVENQSVDGAGVDPSTPEELWRTERPTPPILPPPQGRKEGS